MNTDNENQLDLDIANPPLSEQENLPVDPRIEPLIEQVNSLLERVAALEAKTARL